MRRCTFALGYVARHLPRSCGLHRVRGKRLRLSMSRRGRTYTVRERTERWELQCGCYSLWVSQQQTKYLPGQAHRRTRPSEWRRSQEPESCRSEEFGFSSIISFSTLCFTRIGAYSRDAQSD